MADRASTNKLIERKVSRSHLKRDIPTFKQVLIEDLNIDPLYQRMLNTSRVKEMAKAFNETLFGTLSVGVRSNGLMYVSDGQHRVELAKMVGKETAWAELYASDGPSHEARIFIEKNRSNVKVSAMSIFKALLAANDDESIAIVEAVKRSGLVIDIESRHRNKWPYIRSIDSLRKVISRGGMDHLHAILWVIDEAWRPDPDGLHGSLIDALSWFFTKYPDADFRLMARKLRRVAPKHVTSFADDHQKLMGGGRIPAIGNAFLAIYNKRQRHKLGEDAEQ